MDVIFLLLYVLIPAVTFWRTRSLPWTVLAVATSLSLVGLFINFAIQWGYEWSRTGLQIALLMSLLLVAVAGFIAVMGKRAPVKRQLVSIVLPTAILGGFFLLMWVFLVPNGGFNSPVGFLMGHPGAEDNAKWLDFTANFAAGGAIEQLIPTGGPLQLVFTFIGTAMGVLSLVVVGGYNEVFVAANMVVVTEYFLAVTAPLAVAPLVNARYRSRGQKTGSRIPIPFIWLAGLIVAAANLLAINYGHVTFEYVTSALVLVSIVFLVGGPPSSKWMGLIVIGSLSTIWWPLNIMSFAALLVLVIGLITLFVTTRSRFNFYWAGAFIGVGFAFVATWQPLSSSLRYFFESAGQAAASGMGVISGFGGGVSASAGVSTQRVESLLSSIGLPSFGFADSSLFAAAGGTERVSPLLAILAALALVGAAATISRDHLVNVTSKRQLTLVDQPWVRFIPLIGVVGYAIAINVLDLWSTGQGPNYGAQKIAFLAVIVVVSSTIAVALCFINSYFAVPAGRTSLVGWAAIAGVLYLLVIDSILPRSVALLRPQQWTPPFAYVANENSNWYPAEVNGTSEQSIAQNPVACVYLPAGAPAPTALVEPPDSQRPYACTRILAGLSGMDSEAQALVDWLRREWNTNTPAWTDEYERINSMPDSVKSKTVILMDSTSNVIGLETVQGLLNRFTVERVLQARGIQ